MKNKLLLAIFALIVIVFAGYLSFSPTTIKAGEYDEFATCLKDKGAIFYGAFWCPHCKDQKDLFGKSANKLPYFECSTVDGRGQLSSCTEKDIKSYPTWTFADGTRVETGMSLKELSEKTSCPLPVKSSVKTEIQTESNILFTSTTTTETN